MANRPANNEGNVTVATFLIAIPVTLLIVAAIACSLVFVRWAILSSSLSAARETTMTAGFQMMLKNSNDPGKMVADKLATELRSAGVDDALTVWFIESGNPALGENTRALAYYAVVKTTYGEGTLLGSLEIPCSTTASIVPYAATHVYKPPSASSIEVYRFESGSTICTSATLPSTSQMPQPLSVALEKAESTALTN